jgi:hypothetical protein
MRQLKMLGLAAIAALGLIAFVGAGTASATTLFTNSNGTSPYKAGTEIHFTLTQGSTAILTDGSGNALITCSESTVAGKTTNETGTTVAVSISAWTFGGCNATVDVLANGSVEFHMTETNKATITGKGLQVTTNLFGVTCTYGTGTGTTLGTITGGTAPIVKLNGIGVTKVAGGFLCPSNARWDEEYMLPSPHALYIHA